MPLLSQENRSLICGAIKSVFDKCVHIPGGLLTEGDLQCLLFRELSSIAAFSTPVPSHDAHILATPTHAEVSWFDTNRRLTIKPDITILDPQQLSLLYKIGSVKAPPSKQFHFTGNAFIFELKFVRGPKGIQKTALASIQKDFKKTQDLFSKLNADGDENNVFCYFVIFSRYGVTCNEWNLFYQLHRNDAHWKIIYESLAVPMPQYGSTDV